MKPTAHTGPTSAAARALSELLDAAGLAPAHREVAWLEPSAFGEVPLSDLDRLVIATEQRGIPLGLMEARLDELPEWLALDHALLTALERTDDRGESRVLWLVIRRGSGDRIRLSGHEPSHSWERLVDLDELAVELGVAPDQRVRWAQIDSVGPDRGAGAAAAGLPRDPVRRLLALIRPDRGDLLAVALFSVLVGVLMLSTPIAVQALVNFVALGAAVPSLLVVVLLLFLGLAAAGVLRAVQTWIVEILQRRIFVRAVADLAARLPKVSLEAGGSRYGPELVNRFFDVVTIQKQGSFLLLDGLSVLLSVLVGLAVLAVYHPLLLVFDILLVAIILLIVLGPVRRGIRTAQAESTAKFEVAAWLEEIARNPVLFKSSGVMKLVFERADRLVRAWVDRRADHFSLVFRQSLAALTLQVVASVALLGVGGLLVIQGSLTLGQLVAAELIVTLVVGSVASMGKHIEAFYDLVAATDKLGALLDVPVEDPSGEHHLPCPDGSAVSLELCSVGWTPPGAAPMFCDVSLALEPGERVALRGRDGTGKSMLLQMIWGLRRPTRGTIRVDGRDLREVSLESLRRTVAHIDRVELFEGTVRENIHLARPFVSDEDLRHAIRCMDLFDGLRHLPEGVDTQLYFDGRPLSTGQRARVQVARAIASRPRLLVVSDVFQDLSEVDRRKVLDVLFDDEAPWTLLIASNAPDVLTRCSRTLSMDGSAGARAQPVDTSNEDEPSELPPGDVPRPLQPIG